MKRKLKPVGRVSPTLGRSSAEVTEPPRSPTAHILPPGALADPVWIGATIAFLMVALLTLTKNGTWNDEWIKQYDFTHPESANGASHALHYAIGRVCASIAGVGPFALRFPWAIFAAGCIPLSYLLGLMAADRRLARISAIVMATSPYLLFYAQDANYYAEMMFFALLQGVAFWGFVVSGSFRWLAIGLVAASLQYLVHPFGAVCAGALTLGFVPAVWFSPGGRGGVRLLGRLARRSPIAVLFCAAALAALAYGGLRSGLSHRLISEGVFFLKQFHLGGSYTNIAFNWRFFNATLREFGPSIVSQSAAATLFAWLYPAFASGGAIALGREKKSGVLMIAAVLAMTAAVVFCFKIDRFFHVRYISYVVPFYLFLVAAGLWALGEAIAIRGPRWRYAHAIPTGVWLALLAPFVVQHLIFDGAYLKKVEDYLRPRWSGDDRLFTYEMIWPKTPMIPAGIPPSQHVEMPGLVTIGQGALNEALFKWNLPDFPASWLLHHWNEPRTIHEPLLEWADRRMTRVVDAPSIFQNSPIQWYNKPEPKLSLPLLSAVLHRWDWPDRYIVAPRGLEVDLSKEESRPRYELKQQRQLLSIVETSGGGVRWKSPFLFEFDGRYRFSIDSANGVASLKIDGQSIVASPNTTPGQSVYLAELKSGDHVIEIEIPKHGSGPIASDLPILRINPDFKGGFTVDPFYFAPPDPKSLWILPELGPEHRRLVFKRNAGVAYRFRLAEAGSYRIGFDAIEDRPGPVVMDVLIDGTPRGILAFNGATNHWARKGIIESLNAGEHELGIAFLSERDVMATEPDADNDLIFGGFEIGAARGGEHNDRLVLLSGFVSSLGIAPQFSDFDRDGKIPEGWEYAADATLSVEADHLDPGEKFPLEGSSKILGFEFPSNARGGQLASPPLRVVSGQQLHFDCDVRTDAEGKHSTNIMVEYFDQSGQPARRLWARGTDVNTAVGWTRYAYFGSVPEGAAYVRFQFAFYRNSRPSFSPRAKFEYRRFRILDR